jgi:hypothetical protein
MTSDFFVSRVSVLPPTRDTVRGGMTGTSESACLKIQNDKGQTLSVSFDNNLGLSDRLNRVDVVVFDSNESVVHEGFNPDAKQFHKILTKFLNGEF